MPALELRIQPVDRQILHQESLVLHVSMTNRGEAAMQTPQPDYGCPFAFHLLLPGGDTPVHSFSEVGYQLALSPEPTMPPSVPMAALPPGQTLVYKADLGSLMTELVLPGRYRVKAYYVVGGAAVESPAVELTVVGPRIVALTEMAAAQENNLITVVGQRNQDGSTSLMQRESPGGAPALGPIIRRCTLPAGATLGSLAIAVDLADAPRGHWFAWLEGDRIGACYGWGDDLTSIVPAVPVGLASPRLVETGRRLSDGRAVFLVAGLEGAEVRIREFTYRYVPGPPTAGEPNPVTRTVAFDGGPPRQRILARHVPHGDGLGIELVWAAAEAGETRISTRRYGAGSTKRLYARREPLVALEMNPEGFDGTPAVIDALFGPAGEEEQRRMTFVRIPLNGIGQAVEWTFREPTRLDPANTVKFPDRWAIAPVTLDDPPVLARVHNDLVCLWPAKQGMQEAVAQGDAGKAEYLRVAVLPYLGPDRKRVWAAWVDPDRGIQRRSIR